ncbi:hypothetical protein BC828DRAFT_403129 [Blastocladiella britannica]|nr:hypothetical protein BC828DRAFT_403129 [Blastocladiella britannica]
MASINDLFTKVSHGSGSLNPGSGSGGTGTTAPSRATPSPADLRGRSPATTGRAAHPSSAIGRTASRSEASPSSWRVPGSSSTAAAAGPSSSSATGSTSVTHPAPGGTGPKSHIHAPRPVQLQSRRAEQQQAGPGGVHKAKLGLVMRGSSAVSVAGDADDGGGDSDAHEHTEPVPTTPTAPAAPAWRSVVAPAGSTATGTSVHMPSSPPMGNWGHRDSATDGRDGHAAGRDWRSTSSAGGNSTAANDAAARRREEAMARLRARAGPTHPPGVGPAAPLSPPLGGPSRGGRGGAPAPRPPSQSRGKPPLSPPPPAAAHGGRFGARSGIDLAGAGFGSAPAREAPVAPPKPAVAPKAAAAVTDSSPPPSTPPGEVVAKSPSIDSPKPSKPSTTLQDYLAASGLDGIDSTWADLDDEEDSLLFGPGVVKPVPEPPATDLSRFIHSKMLLEAEKEKQTQTRQRQARDSRTPSAPTSPLLQGLGSNNSRHAPSPDPSDLSSGSRRSSRRGGAQKGRASPRDREDGGRYAAADPRSADPHPDGDNNRNGHRQPPPPRTTAEEESYRSSNSSQATAAAAAPVKRIMQRAVASAVASTSAAAAAANSVARMSYASLPLSADEQERADRSSRLPIGAPSARQRAVSPTRRSGTAPAGDASASDWTPVSPGCSTITPTALNGSGSSLSPGLVSPRMSDSGYAAAFGAPFFAHPPSTGSPSAAVKSSTSDSVPGDTALDSVLHHIELTLHPPTPSRHDTGDEGAGADMGEAEASAMAEPVRSSSRRTSVSSVNPWATPSSPVLQPQLQLQSPSMAESPHNSLRHVLAEEESEATEDVPGIDIAVGMADLDDGQAADQVTAGANLTGDVGQHDHELERSSVRRVHGGADAESDRRQRRKRGRRSRSKKSLTASSSVEMDGAAAVEVPPPVPPPPPMPAATLPPSTSWESTWEVGWDASWGDAPAATPSPDHRQQGIENNDGLQQEQQQRTDRPRGGRDRTPKRPLVVVDHQEDSGHESHLHHQGPASPPPVTAQARVDTRGIARERDAWRRAADAPFDPLAWSSHGPNTANNGRSSRPPSHAGTSVDGEGGGGSSKPRRSGRGRGPRSGGQSRGRGGTGAGAVADGKGGGGGGGGYGDNQQ